MAVMEISIVPIGTKDASVSEFVAELLRIVRSEKDISFELCPMGTVVEAQSAAVLFALAQKLHEYALAGDVKRIVTSIKIDDRKDKKLSMKGKIASVQNKL